MAAELSFLANILLRRSLVRTLALSNRYGSSPHERKNFKNVNGRENGVTERCDYSRVPPNCRFEVDDAASPWTFTKVSSSLPPMPNLSKPNSRLT